MADIVDAKFILETKKRSYYVPVTMEHRNGRIIFLKAPFSLKDEIKSMQGARWHGDDGDPPKKWSVADSYRNRFQIEWLSGGNPYEWFDRDVIEHDFPKFGSPTFGYFDPMHQQRRMANTGLTYHYQIWGAEMGVGKTLAAIMVMKMSGKKGFWWVGPKSSLYGIRQEFAKWGLDEDICPVMVSYEGMMKKMREWKSGDPAPIGVIFDETHRIKTPEAQRTKCAQQLADAIRSEWGKEGFVILMTGTPSPKSPGDWWAQCEIAWPGYIKEGSRQAFERRLGFFRLQDNLSGHAFNTRTAWKDDEQRCGECGLYLNEGHHMLSDGEIIQEDAEFDTHIWRPSVNEVAKLSERLEGLVTLVHKKDCLDLPDKIYKEIVCEPKPALLRVASAITRTAKNVITGLTQLRELSDGFQYRDVEDGYESCPACEDGTEVRFVNPEDPDATIYDTDMLSDDFVDGLERVVAECRRCNGTKKVTKYKRITREVDCPKVDAVVDLLDQNEEQGRIVFFAGFTGSLDRLVKTAQKQGWDTMRVDGRGWKIERLTGKPKEDGTPETETIKLDNPLDYWINPENRKVAFIAHPKSGGVSLTLCQQGDVPGATMAVFYSNDFDPASRAQAEDRVHRIGMGQFAIIVDLMHLPTDRRVRQVLKENRKIELMTMGDFEFGEEVDA